VPEVGAGGIRLHYEERGEGAPILGIHGTGSSAIVWGDAVAELARLGRVIVYDRRGHGRSERPEPYERTSVAEHADDAAALLEALGAVPAVVIGRSYGAAVAVDLALRHPRVVRALALLEPVELELVPSAAEWARALGARLQEVADRDGVHAVGEALISEALGEETWTALPQELRDLFTGNGAAILAEQQGAYVGADADALATIEQPVLLVAATDSLPVLREVATALEAVLPNARTAEVSGGHLIDPAHPDIRAFVTRVLERQ
jgi:pimeloyl-ACP methyl ester carboxylesterase